MKTNFSVFSNKNKGFTLLELMIVIGLIGLLAIIAFPKFQSIRADQALQSEAQKIRTELRYMQQLAFDTKNNCTMTYGSDGSTAYNISLNGKEIKSGRLESNVFFTNTNPETVTMDKNGVPSGESLDFPVIITLSKGNLTTRIEIQAGGEINIR